MSEQDRHTRVDGMMQPGERLALRRPDSVTEKVAE